MRVTPVGCCLLLLLATDTFAHRLDEYLQATRVAVTTNGIDLSFSLTPGVAVAEQVLADIDKNRDGQISEEERSGYVQQLLRDVQLTLDKEALSLRAGEATFPPLFELRSGVGVIQIKATAPVGQLATGTH